MGAMRRMPANEPEDPWIALMCVGILLTSLTATVVLGVIVLYGATIEKLEPVLACFGVGALMMLTAAARLELMAFQRTRTHRR